MMCNESTAYFDALSPSWHQQRPVCISFHTAPRCTLDVEAMCIGIT